MTGRGLQEALLGNVGREEINVTENGVLVGPDNLKSICKASLQGSHLS